MERLFVGLLEFRIICIGAFTIVPNADVEWNWNMCDKYMEYLSKAALENHVAHSSVDESGATLKSCKQQATYNKQLAAGSRQLRFHFCDRFQSDLLELELKLELERESKENEACCGSHPRAWQPS